MITYLVLYVKVWVRHSIFTLFAVYIYSLIYSFNKYFFRAYGVSMLGAGNRNVSWILMMNFQLEKRIKNRGNSLCKKQGGVRKVAYLGL